jgi:hypothetical protein
MVLKLAALALCLWVNHAEGMLCINSRFPMDKVYVSKAMADFIVNNEI